MERDTDRKEQNGKTNLQSRRPLPSRPQGRRPDRDFADLSRGSPWLEQVYRQTPPGRESCVQESLKHEWHKRLYPSLVRGIFVRKVTHEEIFFLLQFDPKADEERQQPRESNKRVGRDGRSQTHEQMTRIDRVTHESIWPPFHKFVPLFQLDISAPIASQRFA